MAVSGTPSEYANSELAPASGGGGGGGLKGTGGPGYPPYADYKQPPPPASVADTIVAGRKMRIHHKNMPMKPARPPPTPAKPKGPKLTDVKMSNRQWRAHARCMRKNNAVLTDRLERMARPTRRQIINMWRENAQRLPPETIYRFRNMLYADEPFKPDQAYQYFVNMKKCKKKACDKLNIGGTAKNLMAICGDRKFVWAKNATVAFARGIQQKLSRPGCFNLADGMLRLSNIILEEICSYMKMRKPNRNCRNPKAKFMVEMADKVAVWIDEILSESDERMLMMDFDEDEEVEQAISNKSVTVVKPVASTPGDDTSGTATPGEEMPGKSELPMEDAGLPKAADATPVSGTSPAAGSTPADASAPSSAPSSGAASPQPPK